MAPHNKKNKRENYFQQNIQRSGQDFLETMPLDKMKLDAVKVFRELARGNIDIDVYGKYFFNPRFIEALISTAETKYNFHLISAMGVDLLLKQNVQGHNIFAVYEYHNSATSAYGLIFAKLTEFRYTGDVNILTDLVMNLVKFRYIF